MIQISPFFQSVLLTSSFLICRGVHGQMVGGYGQQLQGRQNKNGNKNGPDSSAFNIVNGRVFTPGLGILLSPQPFTPMGGDFLHIAIDVSGDGKLPVPPKNIADSLTQVFNFTLFLTSNTLQKNFTISNITTSTPPFADIMNQEPGSTVKHINFEWPDCLVGNGKENIGTTARGDYNITIHQNFRLDGSDFYSIFNLPISVTNGIQQFPGTSQLLTKPPPGPLNGANGGRMSCDAISNPLKNITSLIASVNNPPGQPFQDIQIQTSPGSGGGQIEGPGISNPNTSTRTSNPNTSTRTSNPSTSTRTSNPNASTGNNGNSGSNSIGQTIGQGTDGTQGALEQSFGIRSISGGCLNTAIIAALVVLGTSIVR